MNKNSIIFVLVVLCVVSIALLFKPQSVLFGSALSGIAGYVATTSPAAVSTTPTLLVATSSDCSARIITTYASPVMLTFTDAKGALPTGTFGFLQPASTTVAYDSGLYGCTAVRAYSFAAQTITVSNVR